MIIYGIDDKLEIINAFLSGLFALSYAIGTYFPNKKILSFFYPELIIEIYFFTDYSLYLFIATNKLAHIFTFQSIVCYVSIIPQFLITIGVVSTNEAIASYELDYWKVFRLFSIYRLTRVFIRHNMTMAKVYFQLVFSLLTLLLIFAFTMGMVENRWCITELNKKLSKNPHLALSFSYWE